jgi:peptidoglycan/LPS O-acetylase OafA/YrhL
MLASSSFKGSHFFALPATKLGRVSAGLFLVVLAVFVANLFVHPGTRPVDLVAAVLIVGVSGAFLTGAVALIVHHERSWAVWVATLLPALVLATDVVAGLLDLGG